LLPRRNKYPATFRHATPRISVHRRLVEKTRKGYIETQGSVTLTPTPAPVVKSADSSRPRRASSQPTSTAADPDATPAAEADSPTRDASSTTREATTPPSGDPSLLLDRRVQLHPTDYQRAGWLPWTPLPEPKAGPFDLESCLTTLKKEVAGTYLSCWSFQNLCPSAASPEEAWFWISVMAGLSSPRLENDIAQLEAKARKTDFTQRPSVSDLDDAHKSKESLPPSALRARRAAGDLHVCRLASVEHATFDAPSQRILAVVTDPAGGTAHLEHPWSRRGAAGAEALLRTLLSEHPPVFVAGRVTMTHAGRLLWHPTAVVFQKGRARHVVLPWLTPPDATAPALTLPHQPARHTLPWPAEVLDACADALVTGRRRAPSHRWKALAAAGQARGFSRLPGMVRDATAPDRSAHPFLTLLKAVRLDADLAP
jgi:hypothetical protein